MPPEPGNKNDEQVAVRHSDASGGYVIENHHEEKRVRGISKLAKEGQGQHVKNNRTNGGRQNDSSMKLRIHPHLPIHVLPWNVLRVVRHKVGRGPYLCRSQILLMATCEFLRWMHSVGRMDEGVVSSEKCWSGIEEKMPEISKELNWLRKWTRLTVLEKKICKLNPKILMEEKNWTTWQSHQNIVKNWSRTS